MEGPAHGGAEEIARRSQGKVTLAKRWLRRVRDYAEVEGDGLIDEDMAARALDLQACDDLWVEEDVPGPSPKQL